MSGHDADPGEGPEDIAQDERPGAAEDGEPSDGPETVGPDTAIAFQDVTQLYGPRQGLERLSLEVPTGTIFGLVGPSGSGKTTMVRLALGTLEPQEGHVVTLGKEARTLGRGDRDRVGYLPQDPVLYPELSLRHNLNMMASIHGLAWRGRLWPKGRRGKRARQRVDDVLDLVELRDRSRTRMGKASGGEQRRIALASALIHHPELVLLDEPTAGIDPVLRERLWERFAELRDDGTTLLVTTQYVSEAAHCDLVALLVDGRAGYVGTPDELRTEAADRLGREPRDFDEVFVTLVRDRARLPDRAEHGHGDTVTGALASEPPPGDRHPTDGHEATTHEETRDA